MSIFVNNKDTFAETVYYKEDGDKVVILNDQDKKEEAKKTTITFRYPDFSMSQQITASSVDQSESGPTVNFFKLRNNLIYFLAYKWDVLDEKGKEIELNNANIGKLRPEIAAFFIAKLQERLGGTLLAV